MSLSPSTQDYEGYPTLSSWRELSPESKGQSWLPMPPIRGAGIEFIFLETIAQKLLPGVVVADDTGTSLAESERLESY